MIQLTINGKRAEAPEGATIMEAAKVRESKFPSLCQYKDIHKYGSCRICVVEVGRNEKSPGLLYYESQRRNGCAPIWKVRSARKVLYELLLSDHPKDCLNCGRNQNCELQALGYELGVSESRLEGERSRESVDISPSITRDTGKCILCRRCVTVCNEIQHVGAIQARTVGLKR